MRGRIALCAALACAAALPLFVPPQSSAGQETAAQRYISGREHLAAGRNAEALRDFRAAVSEDPGHAEARYQLGLLLSRTIDTYDEAEAVFLDLPDVAIRTGGKNRDDLLFRTGLALAKLNVRKGAYDAAFALARNIISSAPAGAPVDEAFNTLGLAYYYERRYEDAIFELRRAIKLNPANAEALFNIKTIRTRLEHFHAGKIYSRMGQRREAIDEFRKAIAIDPRFIEARHRLGAELLLAGDPAGALKELDRAESASPDYRKMFEIWYEQGIALRALGRTEEALRKFERTAEARPAFAAAHNEIGVILMERGEFDAAVARFVRAIGIEPRTDYVRNLQAAFARKPR